MIPDEHLPFFITEQLYLLDDPSEAESGGETKEIVAPEPPAPAAVAEPATPIEALTADIIVVYDQCTAAELDLLTKILAAVKVDVDDVLMIEGRPQQPLSFGRLIVFGEVEVDEAGNELYVASTNTKWLRAAPLRSLAASQREKTKLWNSLKGWFGV